MWRKGGGGPGGCREISWGSYNSPIKGCGWLGFEMVVVGVCVCGVCVCGGEADGFRIHLED